LRNFVNVTAFFKDASCVLSC